MFSLRIKIFLAMLLASVLLIISLLGLMQWSFEEGFGDYIQQQQAQRLTSFASELATRYERQGNWRGIRLERPGRRDTTPPDLQPEKYNEFEPMPRELDKDFERPPWPRGSLFLLDRQHKHLAGRYNPAADNLLQPISVNDNVVGYVGQPRHKGPQEFLDKEFARHQSSHFLSIALLAALVSLLVAYPLATLLVRRIGRLLAHIQALSRGDYTATTRVQGHDELSQLAQHLNALGQTLQQNTQAHRTMVADISHELRTPISVMQAQLEAVQDGVQPLTGTTLTRLHQQVTRLKNLVNDLYELSLADLGALTYRKATIDLRELMQELVQSFQPRYQQAGLTLEWQDRCNISPKILGDSQRLQQLFSNLLQNSAQYTHSPGSVQVTLRCESSNVCISIQDSAPGVAAHLQPRLFERLFRAESSRNRNTGGAGLGLSLCRTIAQAHSGEITITDSPLGGLTVTVCLPLAAG